MASSQRKREIRSGEQPERPRMPSGKGVFVRRVLFGAYLAVAFCAHYGPDASGQTSLTGSSFVLQSAGSATLSAPGYVGTYLTVPAGGATVNFTVNAKEGSAAAVAPHMNLVVADSTFGINVAATADTDYSTQNVT